MIRRIVLVTAFGLLIAACGGTGDPDSTTTTGAGPTTTVALTTTTAGGETTTTEPSAAADHTIRIFGFAFIGPAEIQVGETVEVVNQDAVPHTWTSTDGLWASGTLSGTSTFRHTFEEEGTFGFHCTIHPEMTGSITVGG